MLNDMFLSLSEIEDLTGRRRKQAQVKALRFMGIEHIIRPDGAIIISRSHIEKTLDGYIPNPAERRIEPNWDNI